jgi:hypothetical protein
LGASTPLAASAAPSATLTITTIETGPFWCGRLDRRVNDPTLLIILIRRVVLTPPTALVGLVGLTALARTTSTASTAAIATSRSRTVGRRGGRRGSAHRTRSGVAYLW